MTTKQTLLKLADKAGKLRDDIRKVRESSLVTLTPDAEAQVTISERYAALIASKLRTAGKDGE